MPLDLLTDPDPLPDRLAATAADPLALARFTQVLHRRAMATVAPHSIGVHRPATLLRDRTRDDAGAATRAAPLRPRLADQRTSSE